jgi:hypothetical protein
MLGEFPVVSVHLPPSLSSLNQGREDILASGETVGDVLVSAGRDCRALLGLARPDGSLLPGVDVYLGASNVRDLQGLATQVALEECVSVVLAGRSAAVSGQRQGGQPRPFDGVEHVLDQQSELGVAGDLQFAGEEEGVGIFLASEQLEKGGQIGGKGEVGFAVRREQRTEGAISIGE